jgi:hypothetical protein
LSEFIERWLRRIFVGHAENFGESHVCSYSEERLVYEGAFDRSFLENACVTL